MTTQPRVGIELTIPHWYGFEPSVRPEEKSLELPASWDAIRIRDKSGPFGLGVSREGWRARALTEPALHQRAVKVAEVLVKWRAQTLVSVGVGNGMLEYLLHKQAGDLKLRCGDFAPMTVAALHDRFPECSSIEVMDLRRPDWIRSADEVVLFHRVDMELNDVEWRKLFLQLGSRGVRNIIWIPCGLLTAAAIRGQIRAVGTAFLRRRSLVKAGYLRTQARMASLFSGFYRRTDVHCGGTLPIWTLAGRFQ